MNKKPTATVRSRPSAPTLSVVADAPVRPTQAAETTTPPNTSPEQTQGTRTMINSTVDFAAIGKENLEAFTASGKIWAAGVQDLTKQFAATAKASLEEFVSPPSRRSAPSSRSRKRSTCKAPAARPPSPRRSIGAALLPLARAYRAGGFLAMRAHWRENLAWSAVTVTTKWASLLGVALVRTIYYDHIALVQKYESAEKTTGRSE